MSHHTTQMMLRHSASLRTGKAFLFPSCSNFSLRRMTSSGPPPASPSKPGSLSARYDAFVSRWPKIYKIHRMVVDGSRWCFADIKTYIRLRRELSSGAKTLENLSMNELEVFVQMPTELSSVAVVAVLLVAPFGLYVIGFAIILFPRLVLTRHFWSEGQRKRFFQLEVERGLATCALETVLGNPSSVDQVRFGTLDRMYLDMLVALAALYNLYTLPGMRNRLSQRFKAMRQLDKIIASKIESLTEGQLHFHLFIRRISVAADASADDLRQSLKNWVKFTNRLDEAAYMCAPIFFNKKLSK